LWKLPGYFRTLKRNNQQQEQTKQKQHQVGHNSGLNRFACSDPDTTPCPKTLYLFRPAVPNEYVAF
jgi:hypothetical protein